MLSKGFLKFGADFLLRGRRTHVRYNPCPPHPQDQSGGGSHAPTINQAAFVSAFCTNLAAHMRQKQCVKFTLLLFTLKIYILCYALSNTQHIAFPTPAPPVSPSAPRSHPLCRIWLLSHPGSGLSAPLLPSAPVPSPPCRMPLWR